MLPVRGAAGVGHAGAGLAVVALGAGYGSALLLLHECAHLLTARATGVAGRMRLGTRLQFLADVVAGQAGASSA